MIARRNVLLSLALLGALVVAATVPQLAGAKVAEALGRLRGADADWLWLAGAAFIASSGCAAATWRAALGACGARIGWSDALARYAVGALVNTFVPARAGDAVRIALFAKAAGGRELLLTTGGVYVTIGAAHGLAISGLVLAAWLAGAFPLWPVFALAGGAALLLALGVVARGRMASSRVARLLDAVRALERSPRQAARVFGWTLAQTGMRIAAAAAAAAALGVPNPLLAAAVIVPALEVAGVFPLTPGNWGVKSGAIVVALKTQGVGLVTGLSAGLAFHAVETMAGLTVGTAGALYLVAYPSPLVRRLALGAAAAGACFGVAAVGLVSFGLV